MFLACRLKLDKIVWEFIPQVDWCGVLGVAVVDLILWLAKTLISSHKPKR